MCRRCNGKGRLAALRRHPDWYDDLFPELAEQQAESRMARLENNLLHLSEIITDSVERRQPRPTPRPQSSPQPPNNGLKALDL